MKRSVITLVYFTLLVMITNCGSSAKKVDSGLMDVAPRSAGFVHYFTARPQSVAPGQKVTLDWNLPNAQDVEIEGVIRRLPAAGTYVVQPSQSTNYTIRGRSLDGQELSRRIRVDVENHRDYGNLEYFWSSNLTIREGEAATLYWKAHHCSHTILEAVGHPEWTQYLGCEGTIEVRPTETTHWILRSFDLDNAPSGYGELVIQVNPLPTPSPVIEGFWTNYLYLDAGSSANIYWIVRDASEIYLSTDPGQPQAASGMITVRPLQTTTYVLTAYSVTGEVVSSQFTITVTSRNPEIRAFAADQPSLELGQQTTLRWDVAYCSKVELIGDDFNLNLACTGSWAIVPTQTTNYTLIATGFSGELVNQIITVRVVLPQPAPTVDYFYPDAASIDPGQTTTLRWKVQNCSKVVINNAELPCESTLDVRPIASQVYQLTAYNVDGRKQSSASVSVSVRPPPPPKIDYFYASSTSIKWEESTTLHWKVTNAVKVELIGDSAQQVASTATLEFQLTHTVNFVLRVTGKSGEVIDVPLTVTVQPPTQDDLLKKLLEEMQKGG